MYVQFGAGLCGPSGWENFDASPTVRLQRLPVVGGVGKLAGPVFPDNVQYGDITKGLPVPDGKVDGVYASHVLEHLSYEDAHTALRNTFKMLRSDGIFRCIVPDLAERARRYVAALDQQSASARFHAVCLVEWTPSLDAPEEVSGRRKASYRCGDALSATRKTRRSMPSKCRIAS